MHTPFRVAILSTSHANLYPHAPVLSSSPSNIHSLPSTPQVFPDGVSQAFELPTSCAILFFGISPLGSVVGVQAATQQQLN